MKKNKQNKKIEEIYSEKVVIRPLSGKRPIHAEHNHKAANQELLSTLLSQLLQEWENKKIPESLKDVNSLFISMLPIRKAILYVTKEISDLKSYNSLSQICLKAIHAREESLQSIKEMNEYLTKDKEWINIIEIKLECAEILHAHRMLTLNVAETIERWKDFFSFELSDFKAEFYYNPK